MRTRYYFGEEKISPEEKQYIEKRLDKFKDLLIGSKDYDEDELFLDFRLSKDKKGFWNMEIVFDTPYNSYRASKQNKTITETFDLIQEAIKKQIRRDKERWQDLKERGRRSIRKSNSISDNARF
ncbi:MAG: HPF/RaiA family ribosome-associated protein [Candidatus Moraniibacteriota bacterium]